MRIYNSLTRNKAEFVPIEPGRVRIYVCGMTVYDYCHVGHARVLVVFDVVVRYLRAAGLDVTYVRNITDIDDKIIQRAAQNGEPVAALTARFIAAMHEDAAALGVLPPEREPRATESLAEIRAMIAALLAKGYAYRAENGDVYYRVARFASYGRLSGRQLDELRAGARVAVDEAKDDPLDFALWKAAKPSEPSWPAPWGAGRPGWHIECSAMSTSCLGEHFDIHGGGMDLMFPHHENEIAQSEAATGHTFVNVWMHNGFVQVDEQKMSKSLGNFFTVREVLARYAPEVMRYFILTSHYRSPLNYSDAHLDNARAALDRLYGALRGLADTGAQGGGDYEERLREAMDDDFNTPVALAVLFDLAGEINRAKEAGDTEQAGRLGRRLKRLGGLLGLLQQDPAAYFQGIAAPAPLASSGAIPRPGAGSGSFRDQIESLIERRNAARRRKDWAAADRIRAELDAAGVTLEDGPAGTTWRRK